MKFRQDFLQGCAEKTSGRFYLAILAGVTTESLALFLHFCAWIDVSDYHLGYLLGLGVGVVLGGVVGVVRIRRRMAAGIFQQRKAMFAK